MWDLSGAEVTGSCEVPKLGARICIFKGSTYLQLLSSSPVLAFLSI